MKFWRTSANALVVVALAAMTYPAKAADTTKITYTYFEHPVEVPGGKVLPQGEYAFKMVDDSSPVKVIQILLALPGGTVGTPSNYNANKPMQVAATLVAVPDYRNRRGRGTVTYWQTRGGGPNALRTLSFPLDDESLEFAYPRARAADRHLAGTDRLPLGAQHRGARRLKADARTRAQQEDACARIAGLARAKRPLSDLGKRPRRSPRSGDSARP